MKASLFAAILLFAPPVASEFYLDLGFSYVDELEFTEKASVTFNDFTISAERSATLDVREIVPMVRFGYLWKGVGVELDYVGYSSTNIGRINMFYRFK